MIVDGERRRAPWLVATAAVLVLVPVAGRARVLDVAPVTQQSILWCWVAVGEMVFVHYGVPNLNPRGRYQCGVVGTLAFGTSAHGCAYDCAACQVPAGSPQAIERMIEEYPRRAAVATRRSVARLSAHFRPAPLPEATLRDEIDAGDPVIAGISPAGPAPRGAAQHVALVVGYRKADGELQLAVNDPFPFSGVANPYFAAGATVRKTGSYWIARDAFVTRLRWTESFTIERRGDVAAPRDARRCCHVGPVGPAACVLHPIGTLPEGTPCQCDYGLAGIFVGRACR